MELQIQDLVSSIKKDGIDSANQQAAAILADARKQADAISAQQAKRDAVLAFRQEVQQEFEKILAADVGKALDQQTLAKLIQAALQGEDVSGYAVEVGQVTDGIRQQLAQELAIPREEVVLAMDAIVDPVSLYEPIYDSGGDAICVMDQVSDTKNTDERWTERIALKDAMKLLDPRERRILSLRFYEGKTQMEVSAEVGISQAQVSRLEKNALRTIRARMEG